MARSTRLIKNIYTLWGRKRFLLPVTYLTTNIVYPIIIILETNIHRVGFKPNNRIKVTRAYKYSHIIRKLIEKDFSPSKSIPLRSKTGFVTRLFRNQIQTMYIGMMLMS